MNNIGLEWPYCTFPDWQHWGRCSCYSPEEFAALSLNWCPLFLNFQTIGTVESGNSLEWNFRARVDLIHRAIEMGELDKNLVPQDVLSWFAQKDLSYPPGLSGSIFKYSHQLAFLDSGESSGGLVDDLPVDSKIRCSGAVSAGETAANDNGIINPKKLKSLETMIAAMSIEGYKYNPTDKKSPVPKEIADDAAKLGLSISSETVKKHLDSSFEGSGAVLPDKE